MTKAETLDKKAYTLPAYFKNLIYKHDEKDNGFICGEKLEGYKIKEIEGEKQRLRVCVEGIKRVYRFSKLCKMFYT